MLAILKLISPRAYLLIAVLILCLGCELHGRHAEAKKWEMREIAANAAAEQKLTDLRKEVLEKETAAKNRVALIESQFKEDKQNAQIQIDKLRTNVRSGSVRLSIPTVACSGNTLPETAGNAAGTTQEARAELDAETAQHLIDIAAEGDAAIRQLNALIEAATVK